MERYSLLSPKQFKENCQNVSRVLTGMGFPNRFQISIDAASFYTGRHRVVFIYNSEKFGPIWTENLDLSIRIKESNDFLKVSEVTA